MKRNYALCKVIGLLFVLSLCFLMSLPPSVYAATFTVNNTTDTVDANPGDGVCSDASGNCTLRAAIMETNALTGADIINMPAGTYTLSIIGTDEDTSDTGDLDISDDLTINGAGETDTIIDANEIDRVLHIIGSVIVEIYGLAIKNGGGKAPFNGGGIFNEEGTVTLTNSTISNNFAFEGLAGGGGINNVGIMILINCNISNNFGVSPPGGEGGGGGGIFNRGKLTLNNCIVSNNSEGGGIFNLVGTVILDNSTVSTNEFGGIRNSSILSIGRSTITMTNSTVSGNTGEGIDNVSSIMTLINTTVSGNTGGGIRSSGISPKLSLINSTVSNNSADEGGGIYRIGGGTLTLNNCIVSMNHGGDCGGPTPITSLGYNLDGDGSCNLTQPHDLPNSDPLIGPLADNGGPTLTHALLSGSPAIDAADPNNCPPPITDQRGEPRPVDGDGNGVIICDIGAVEFQGANQSPVAICQNVTVPTESGLCTADISIDDGSYDPDGDMITLEQTPPGPYDLGDTDVLLIVTDDKGAFDTCEATVTVVDEGAPKISSVTASPNKLWPPNHKMVPVVLAIDATDNCDLKPVCQIISVESNEPVDGLGDGNTVPDWVITDDLTVKLRAERSGAGYGRAYTIAVECTDSSENCSTDTVMVTVAHDEGKKNSQNNKKKK